MAAWRVYGGTLRARLFWSGLVFMGLGPTALAEEAAPPPATDPVKPAEEDVDLNDVAWRGIHDSFRLLLAGESRDARMVLSLLLQRYPNHASAALATTILSSTAIQLGPARLDHERSQEVADPVVGNAPWRDYEEAFLALARGACPDDVRSRLRQITVNWPNTAAARRSQALVDSVASTVPKTKPLASPTKTLVADKDRRNEAGFSEWYGTPLIAADLVLVTSAFMAFTHMSEDVLAVSVGLDISAGFIVHSVVYNRWGRRGRGIGKGILSILLRGGLAFGLCATKPGGFNGDIMVAPGRLVLGLAIADVIDDILLARIYVSPEDLSGINILPIAWTTPQGGRLGLMARW